MEITLFHYLVLSMALFTLGLVGVFTRRNAIVVLMSLELMLNAANLNFIAFSRFHGGMEGQIFALFVICVAAGEVAVGLAIVLSLYRNRETADVADMDLLKG